MWKEWEAYVLSLREEIIKVRRDLHQIPETAWEEHKTQAYLVKELKKLDCTIIDGEKVTGHDTGIIAEFQSDISCGPSVDGKPPVLILRFDLDALSVTESNAPSHYPEREGFASCHPGFMHACGHDGHAAMGLACAGVISRFRSQLYATVRLIFQPAEEGCKGARAITERGWLDDADYLLSGHIVGRDYDPGNTADVIPGVSASLATTKLDVTFHGISCHASEPSLGISVMPAIASAVLGMEKIPSPLSSPSEGKALLNVGRISAGEGRNIIAGEGRLELETRGSTTEWNRYMEEQALSILKASAEEYGCRIDIEILGRCPSVESTPRLCDLTLEVCGSLPALRCGRTPAVFKASEDISIMMEHVKAHGGEAAYLLFPTDTTAPLHNRSYDFDEDILTKGVLAFCRLVYALAV